MIEVGDGRGLANKQESEKNRMNIVKFFKDNPGATKVQCAKSLGINKVTVARHVKIILSEDLSTGE